jgi:hypothetical protein
MQLNTRPDITQVKVLFDDGTEEILSQKPLGTGQPSQCTFLAQRSDGSFRITLRLDWDDQNVNSDPMLDADIYRNGKKYTIDRKSWHHTEKRCVNGEWIYHFQFENISIKFKAQITSERTLQSVANVLPRSGDLEGNTELVLESDSGALEVTAASQIFCTGCQTPKAHRLVVDHNKEILATCDCTDKDDETASRANRGP